tara:strand:- start:54 stop:374 length:321 start_codon:yes stop_codon:yes gene_type:complete
MALLALTKGQLLVNIYKMYKENDMTSLYDKKFLTYSIEELASEYIRIENITKEKMNNNTICDIDKIIKLNSPDCDSDSDSSISGNSNNSDDYFMNKATMINPNCCH